MNKNLFKNNASSILNVGLSVSSTEVSVTAGSEVLFPLIDEIGDYFKLTIIDTSGNFEIVKVIATNSNLFTVVRGQEGTSNLAFPAGSTVELRLTAESLEELRDLPISTTTTSGIVRLATDAEVLSGTNNSVAVSAGALKRQGIINIELLKRMPQLFTGTFSGIYPIGKNGVVDTDWQICNGTNGTPDLRNVFIKGGDGANTGTQDRDPSYTITANTGATTLSIAQIPSHNHNAQPNHLPAGQGQSGGSSSYSGSGGNCVVHDAGPLGFYDLGARWGYSTYTVTQPDGFVRCEPQRIVYDTSVLVSGNTGSSQAHNHSISIPLKTTNLNPPYYTLAYIMYIGE